MMRYGVIRGQQSLRVSALRRSTSLGLLALEIDGERRQGLDASMDSFVATVGGICSPFDERRPDRRSLR